MSPYLQISGYLPVVSLILCIAGLSSHTQASDRLFPLWGDLAEQHGQTLPRTYGLGLSVMPMNQDFLIEKLDIKFSDGSSLPLNPGDLDIQSVTGSSVNYSLRADMWLLPFLNLYAIAGHTKGSTDTIINIPSGALPGLGDTINFGLEYNGPSVGGGMTLAYGAGDWFITLDANHTESSLNISDSKITATVTTLRTGMLYDTEYFGRASIWLGSMHQDINQTFGGTVDFLPGFPSVDYVVSESAADENNLLAGVSLEIDQHWYTTFELGMHTRNQLLAMLMYRF